MNVSLLSYTQFPEKIVACAAKECYSKSDPDKLMDGLTNDKISSFLDRLDSYSHFSPMEHASFTFSISGVSRAFLAQITRHRLASFSVRSQRYVNMNDAGFVEPEAIKNNSVTHDIFEQAVSSAKTYYKLITEELTYAYIESGMNDSVAKKKAQEDARFVLPEATETSMVVTMNARELNHFFSMRLCNRAQLEIRTVAEEMFKLVYPIAPHLFSKTGPSCVSGTCNEGGMSCGKLFEMREKYKNIKNI